MRPKQESSHGAQRPLHPRSLRQHVALVRPRARRHSLPRRERSRRRRSAVSSTTPAPARSGRGCRFESRRSLAARISISPATAASRRAGAIARATISPRSGSQRQIEAEHRPATAEEQAQLIRFTGFGASELANGVFRRPGEDEFRKGWEAIGAELEARCRRRVLRLARALHAVCPLHAGVHRPRGLGGCACGSASAAAACSSPASAAACFRR